jgi:hypothetical protein
MSSFAFIPAFASSSSAVAVSSNAIMPSVSLALTTDKNPVWAGYGVYSSAGGVVTAIQASFKQPKITCNSALASPQAAFVLAGIDGIGAGADFEALGTLAVCAVGATTPTYSEASTVTMAPVLTIKPGHIYSATITESAGTFTYTLKDVTTGKVSTGSGTNANALLNAAECIVDRASSSGFPLPLANFGKVLFGQDNTKVTDTCYATASGVTNAIGAFTSPLLVVKFVLYNSALTIIDAKPSALTTDKSSFKVAWKAAGP